MDRQSARAHTAALLRLPDVLRRTGMSRSWVYAQMASGDFPQPVRLGGRAVAWRESDLTRWLDGLASAGASDPKRA